MSDFNPTTDLAPDQPYIVDGLDWSWVFVVYREIPEYPDYQIGTNQTVWSRKPCGARKRVSGTQWRQIVLVNKNKYRSFLLYRNGARKLVSFHVFLMKTFIGPCPPGKVCCHNDDNKENNSLRNLRYDTQSANRLDSYRNGGPGLGSTNHQAKLTEADVIEMRGLSAKGWSSSRLARKYGLASSVVRRIVRGDAWKHVPLV
jgi:hypothetical protein